ncbi:ammonium transporter 2-like protein [Trifolium pratense]|uniref:Ammonium transporter 2-like protein n=1 Tax=Trifolium pratense TaxID=57577 RepID=A0A2K3KZV7_TRIPR|nr:ammonium transporter 2-like protein [Trifolium pratense]PNX80345.1 ammonium transporter 2-like protein [Trifolium pratense]
MSDQLETGDDAVNGEEAYALWDDGEKYNPTRHGSSSKADGIAVLPYVIGARDDVVVVDGSPFEPSFPVSKVSQWVVPVAAFPLWINGLEFIAFRESNLSTMPCTRRTCRRMEKLVFKINS